MLGKRYKRRGKPYIVNHYPSRTKENTRWRLERDPKTKTHHVGLEARSHTRPYLG